MDRVVILALCGFLFLASADAELQLTPVLDEYELDGVKLQQLLFQDGKKQVKYTPPPGWKYAGGGSRLVLHPSGTSYAEAEIKVLKLGGPQVFDDDTIKQLSDEAIASLPANSQNVTIVSQEKNPLMIERKETFLLKITYDSSGNGYARSILFVNRKEEQVRCQFTSYRSVFPQLQKAFQSSQYSWQDL